MGKKVESVKGRITGGRFCCPPITELSMKRGQLFITSGETQLAVTWLQVGHRQRLLDALNATSEYIANNCINKFITERKSGTFLIEKDDFVFPPSDPE